MEKRFCPPSCPLRLVIWWLALCLSASTKLASGQTTSIHQITGISVNSQRAAVLTLAGSPPAPLQKYYDLFPLEASANLVAWSPVATVVRTNVTNEVAFVDAAAPVVIAMDHTDTYATVFPPDRLVVGGNVWSFDFLNDRLKDVKFLLDYGCQVSHCGP
jgi:hypothetical protein